MAYKVREERVEGRQVVAGRAQAAPGELGPAMMACLDRVWPVLREAGARTGHNVAVYHGNEPVAIEAGVEVFGAVPPLPDGLHAGMTPSGRVAATTHWGDYAALGAAYRAISEWCRDRDKPLTDERWEVYGDWSDDPSQVRTDVFWLLDAT